MKNLPKIGARTLKTAFSVFCCITLLHTLNRDGYLFACIAAIICMQPTVEDSFKMGTNRVIGTLFGAFIGFLFSMVSLLFINHNIIITAAITSIGIIALIYTLNLMKLTPCIVIACVTYLVILLNVGIDGWFVYSINRTVDTLIGVIVGILINSYIHVPKGKKK